MNNENNNRNLDELESRTDELFSDPDDNLPDLVADKTTIILEDEDGEKSEYEFLDLIEYKGKKYVVLYPVDDEEGTPEVLILRIKKSIFSKEESYVSVDNDNILNEVFNIFRDKFKDEFNFVD